MKYFYSHLIEIDSIISSLDEMDLTDEEKLHLAKLLDSSLHHTILDAIFSQLSDMDKRVFMQHVSSGDHDKIWKFLNEKIDGVENKIRKSAEELVREMHKDIKESKKFR